MASLEKLTQRLVYNVKLICDVCGLHEWFSSVTEPDLEATIDARGWTRFGPSGADLCFKCSGTSPNTVVQVTKALA